MPLQAHVPGSGENGEEETPWKHTSFTGMC